MTVLMKADCTAPGRSLFLFLTEQGIGRGSMQTGKGEECTLFWYSVQQLKCWFPVILFWPFFQSRKDQELFQNFTSPECVYIYIYLYKLYTTYKNSWNMTMSRTSYNVFLVLTGNTLPWTSKDIILAGEGKKKKKRKERKLKQTNKQRNQQKTSSPPPKQHHHQQQQTQTKNHMVTFIQSTDTFRPVTATVLQPTSQHLPATMKQSFQCHVLNTVSKWQTLITNFQHLSATKKQSFQCHVLNTVSDKHWSLISSTCQQQWNSHSSAMCWIQWVSDKHWSLISSTCQQQRNSHSSAMCWIRRVSDKHWSLISSICQRQSNSHSSAMCWIQWVSDKHWSLISSICQQQTVIPVPCD